MRTKRIQKSRRRVNKNKRRTIRRKSKGGLGRFGDMISSASFHTKEKLDNFMNPVRVEKPREVSEAMRFWREYDASLHNKINDLNCKNVSAQYKHTDCAELEEASAKQDELAKKYSN